MSLRNSSVFHVTSLSRRELSRIGYSNANAEYAVLGLARFAEEKPMVPVQGAPRAPCRRINLLSYICGPATPGIRGRQISLIICCDRWSNLESNWPHWEHM